VPCHRTLTALALALLIVVASCDTTERTAMHTPPAPTVRTTPTLELDPTVIIDANRREAEHRQLLDFLASLTTPIVEVEPVVPAAADLPREYVSSGGPTSCDGHVVAAEILRRESGCDYGAYNPSGCEGRGCVGLYQLDEGHFAAVSPWNSNTSGVCHGLDSSSPADQDECASRLGPGAWR
jgi:hypothetical protein